MNIWMTLGKALDLYPEKIAVIDGDRSYTYQQIGERVTGLARFFQNRGIQQEDRISILEVNSHAFLETYTQLPALAPFSIRSITAWQPKKSLIF